MSRWVSSGSLVFSFLFFSYAHSVFLSFRHVHLLPHLNSVTGAGSSFIGEPKQVTQRPSNQHKILASPTTGHLKITFVVGLYRKVLSWLSWLLSVLFNTSECISRKTKRNHEKMFSVCIVHLYFVSWFCLVMLYHEKLPLLWKVCQ